MCAETTAEQTESEGIDGAHGQARGGGDGGVFLRHQHRPLLSAIAIRFHKLRVGFKQPWVLFGERSTLYHLHSQYFVGTTQYKRHKYNQV